MFILDKFCVSKIIHYTIKIFNCTNKVKQGDTALFYCALLEKVKAIYHSKWDLIPICNILLSQDNIRPHTTDAIHNNNKKKISLNKTQTFFMHGLLFV